MKTGFRLSENTGDRRVGGTHVHRRGTDWPKYEIVEAGLGLGIAPVTIFILHPTMDSA